MIARYPGFIDIHVHLRDPGATHKEDFTTGTRAAIKGGFTYVLDMPNNPTKPTITLDRLNEKRKLSNKKSLCDVGFYYGTNGENTDSFSSAWRRPDVFGLKVYCNHTTGELLVDDPKTLEKIFSSWGSEKPILVHAEGETLVQIIELTKHFKRRLHVCHISQKSEVSLVRKAKKRGQDVSAGVTPHHLFLSAGHLQKLGPYALVKPPMDPAAHQSSLWEGLQDGTIDLVESDHAPHTKEEKESDKPPFGVPGLETTLGLLWKAIKEKRLRKDAVVKLLYINPKKIFSIPDQIHTFVVLDSDVPYRVEKDYETKCGWSPYDGWELYGKPQAVLFKGKKL